MTTNRQRLEWFQEHYRSHLATINHLVLYNSGSILNPREMPAEMLDKIVAFAGSLPAVSVISLDSREPFIRPGTLKRILLTAGPRISVRPILGVESADDRIRNDVLHKAMPGRTAIDCVFQELKKLAVEFGPARIGLDVNIVIAGPGTNSETAVDDAVFTARFALTTGTEHGVPVDLNLHPYYAGSRGLARFPDHPRCSLAATVQAVTKIAALVHSMGTAASMFIGWNDEGHDSERQQRHLETKLARAVFEQFNGE